MAVLGPHYSDLEVALADFRLAPEFSLVTSMHQGGGAARSRQGWLVLERNGLLGRYINIVHGRSFNAGTPNIPGSWSDVLGYSPERDDTGTRTPLTGRLHDLGVRPSIGIDLESGLSGEMFLAARISLAHQRALDNFDYRNSPGGAPIPETTTITTDEALSLGNHRRRTHDGSR